MAQLKSQMKLPLPVCPAFLHHRNGQQNQAARADRAVLRKMIAQHLGGVTPAQGSVDTYAREGVPLGATISGLEVSPTDSESIRLWVVRHAVDGAGREVPALVLSFGSVRSEPSPSTLWRFAKAVHFASEAGLPAQKYTIFCLSEEWAKGELGNAPLVEVDVTEDIRDRLPLVPEWLEKEAAILADPDPDKVRNSRECAMCGLNQVSIGRNTCPALDVGDPPTTAVLPGTAGASVRKKLGIMLLKDVPDSAFSKSSRAEQLTRVRDAHVKQASVVDVTALANAIAALDVMTGDNPLCFLDFETVAFNVPRWTGCAAGVQVPFQWSLHRQHRGELIHREFISLNGDDPTRACAEALCAAAAMELGPVVGYNTSFEKGVLLWLADRYPDLGAYLRNIAERLWDLYPVVERTYYHPAMAGSYSLKAVAPAVLGFDPYAGLGIADGEAAMDAFVFSSSYHEYETTTIATAKSLTEYCKTDTLCTVLVLEKFRAWLTPYEASIASLESEELVL